MRILVWIFVPIIAVWSWAKAVLLLPLTLHQYLEAAKLERLAAGLAHHAEVASMLWPMNAAYREVSHRIIADYISPTYGARIPPRRQEIPDLPASAFSDANAAGVAAMVQKAGPKKTEKVANLADK